MESKRIAVLMTCHNRQEKTLASLKALCKQVLAPQVLVQIYLVDDGSTDNTAEAVRTNYPEVYVLRGDGSLFWNGGMRLAFSASLKVGYEYYLWLNDDTLLEPDALSNLLDTHSYVVAQGSLNSIVVGSTRDQLTRELTYGGVQSGWHPLKFKLVEPGDKPRMSKTMHGNCVLIPHVVVERVGNLDEAFTHNAGDLDYGLRARKLGCSVWVAPGYVGICSTNPLNGTWKDKHLPLHERLKKVVQPKALPPQERKIFAKRHAGSFWYVYWAFPYVRVLTSSLFPFLES